MVSNDIVIEAALQKIARLERLILWLAKTYGDNNPHFHYQTFNGNPLPENVELMETWNQVVRSKKHQ